jgi:hypothetical protein
MSRDHISNALTRFLHSALVPAFTWAACVGCAAFEPQEPKYAPSAPTALFPTRERIAELPALPPAIQLFGTKDVAVDEWSIESPPLPSEGPYDDPSAWGSLLRDLMKTRTASVSLSPAMRCAAGEIGRFHLKNHALPVENLRRFIVARCGGETTNLSPFVWSANAPPTIGDEQIIARARDSFANAIEEALSHGHHLVGLAAVRDAQRVSVVLAIGEDEARLEPGTRRIDSTRHVTLRGTARGEYGHISALVNRGDFGVSHCDSDHRAHPPEFALSCELAQGDSFDWVELVGVKRGSVMFHPLAEVLIYDGGAGSVAYRVKNHGAPAPVSTPPEFTKLLVDRVNAVRALGGMHELALAAKQSLENERLAGTILSAASQDRDDTADTAALGLLAGWDVDEGMIRGGELFLSAAATRDVMTWVESAIERPIGRIALLDPEARVIAVGPSIPEGVLGLGAAVTTYSLFGAEGHRADEEAFFQRIAKARVARGLLPPTRVPASKEIERLAASVLTENMTPLGALHLMGASSRESTGYVLETNSLRDVAVPEVFLTAAPLAITLTITHHRAPGAAWGQYVVLTLLRGGQ